MRSWPGTGTSQGPCALCTRRPPCRALRGTPSACPSPDGSARCALLGVGDRGRGVDEPDVAERLREVPEQLTGRRVDLLREQADVVHVRGGPLERGPGALHLPRHRLRLCEPERAEEERALLSRKPILREVSVNEPAIVREPLL